MNKRLNKKALSPVVASILLIAVSVVVSVLFAMYVGGLSSQPSVEQQPVSFKCNLGEMMYMYSDSHGTHRFYFHGVNWNNETKTNTLLMGHSLFDYGMANMEIQLDYAQIEDGKPIFRLGDKIYKITSLMVDQIWFEEVNP